MSYSKSINKQQNRTGSLFRKNLKRNPIKSNFQFVTTVMYIHCNPKHHGMTNDYLNYEWSSYNRILDNKKSKLKKSEVLGYFDTKENYTYMHENYSGIIDEIENQL